MASAVPAYYTASSLCNTITLLFPAPGWRAQRGRPSATIELGEEGGSAGGGGGAVGIQRVGFGGPGEEREAQGRVAAAFIARPGSWTPVRPRARSAAAPGSCAPFRVSQPRLGDCGLPLAGWAVRYRRATVPWAGSCALGSGKGSLALHRRAVPGGAAAGAPAPRARWLQRCISGASGRRRETSARVAWGKGCPGGCGFISFPPSLTSSHPQGEMESVKCCESDGAWAGNGAAQGQSPWRRCYCPL